MCDLAKSWFICQAKVREEKRAKYFLEEKGFEVYLPTMETQRILGSTVIFVQKPLFPNYLFVRFNEEAHLSSIRWTRGVRKILPDCGRPVAVEDAVVNALRGFAHKDGIIRKRPFKKHDKIRVLQGPFKELLGIFEEWASDKGRVKILLSFINYQVRLELHHTLVEKVA